MVTLLEYWGSSANRFVIRKTVNTPAAIWCRRNFSAARVVYVATASRISVSVVIGRPKERETIKLCFGGGQSSKRLFEKSFIGGISAVHYGHDYNTIPYRPH